MKDHFAVWDIPEVLKLWPVPEGSDDRVFVSVAGLGELEITGAFRRQAFKGEGVLVFTTEISA